MDTTTARSPMRQLPVPSAPTPQDHEETTWVVDVATGRVVRRTAASQPSGASTALAS
jgi:hypothetical protein